MYEYYAQISNYISTYWVTLLFTAITAALGALYRKVNKIAKSTLERNNAISEGVKAILSNKITDKYKYYRDKGFCPVEEKRNVESLHVPYKNLGGNGTIDNLVMKIQNMPSEKPVKFNNTNERRTKNENSNIQRTWKTRVRGSRNHK